MYHRLYKVSRFGLWVGLLTALAYFLTPSYMLIVYANAKFATFISPILYPGPHDWVIQAQGTNQLVGVTFGFYLAFLSAFGMYATQARDNSGA